MGPEGYGEGMKRSEVPTGWAKGTKVFVVPVVNVEALSRLASKYELVQSPCMQIGRQVSRQCGTHDMDGCEQRARSSRQARAAPASSPTCSPAQSWRTRAGAEQQNRSTVVRVAVVLITIAILS